MGQNFIGIPPAITSIIFMEPNQFFTESYVTISSCYENTEEDKDNTVTLLQCCGYIHIESLSNISAGTVPKSLYLVIRI